MIENGIITALNGDKATVALPPKKACGGCGKCALGKGGKEMELTAENTAGAKKGDRVAVEVPFRDPLASSFILFGLPLLGLLAGAGIGYLLFPGDGPAGNGAAVGFGLAALTAVILLVRRRERNYCRKEENRVRIVGIITPDSEKATPN